MAESREYWSFSFTTRVLGTRAEALACHEALQAIIEGGIYDQKAEKTYTVSSKIERGDLTANASRNPATDPHR